jgi:hypothetical protein
MPRSASPVLTCGKSGETSRVNVPVLPSPRATAGRSHPRCGVHPPGREWLRRWAWAGIVRRASSWILRARRRRHLRGAAVYGALLMGCNVDRIAIDIENTAAGRSMPESAQAPPVHRRSPSGRSAYKHFRWRWGLGALGSAPGVAGGAQWYEYRQQDGGPGHGGDDGVFERPRAVGWDGGIAEEGARGAREGAEGVPVCQDV